MKGLYKLVGSEVTECSDPIEWAISREKTRIIARDKIGGVLVSTVFTGVDFSFFGNPPLVFETMIFGGSRDGYEAQYASLEDALQGHRAQVALVKKEVGVCDDGEFKELL